MQIMENTYIDRKLNMDVDEVYDDYAKEVFGRPGYPKRAELKAVILHEFLSPHTKGISSIADVGGCFGYCINKLSSLYKNKNNLNIKDETVYELGQEYLVRGPGIFPQINFLHASKMGNKKYDLVLLCDVLEHVVDYEEFLSQIKKITNSYVLVWSPLELTAFRRILIRLKLLPKIKWGPEHPEKHVNFWGEKEVLDILKNHFEILKVGYHTGRDMAGDYAKEVKALDKPAIVKFFSKFTKFIPDYLYIKLIGGNIIILCKSKPL